MGSPTTASTSSRPSRSTRTGSRSFAAPGPASSGGYEMAELNAGDQIAELRVTPDKYTPHRYAGASGDFNPIHIDPEFAKAVGLPNTILHGLYMMGLVARASTEAAGGDPGSLMRLSVELRGMSAPGTVITVTGTVDAGEHGQATIGDVGAHGV